MLDHEDKEPPFLSVFNHLPPIPNAPFSGVLYVFHKHGLLDGIEFRQPMDDEMEAVKGFLDGLSGSQHALSKLDNPKYRGSVVAAWIDDCVIGAAVVTEDLDVDALKSNFELDTLSDLHHPKVGKLEMLHMNPIFGHRCGFGHNEDWIRQ